MIPDWRSAVLDALALVLPVECVGCGAPDRNVCDRCRGGLRPEPMPRVLEDGTPVWSGLSYEGVARAALLAAKEHGRTSLVRHLAPALRAAVDRTERDALLCPIPASAPARRRRGTDPVAMLARRAGLPVEPLLTSTARTSQKTLGVADRTRNRVGAFRLATVVTGRRIVLVDDVVTTGATLREAAGVLREGGAIVLGAATAAATPRRYGRPSTIPADPPPLARDFREARD